MSPPFQSSLSHQANLSFFIEMAGSNKKNANMKQPKASFRDRKIVVTCDDY